MCEGWDGYPAKLSGATGHNRQALFRDVKETVLQLRCVLQLIVLKQQLRRQHRSKICVPEVAMRQFGSCLTNSNVRFGRKLCRC